MARSGGIWKGCLRRQPFQLLKTESPVHFDQAELQDENATNTFSEGQCMLVQSSFACGLSAREKPGYSWYCVISIPLGVSLKMKVR